MGILKTNSNLTQNLIKKKKLSKRKLSWLTSRSKLKRKDKNYSNSSSKKPESHRIGLIETLDQSQMQELTQMTSSSLNKLPGNTPVKLIKTKTLKCKLLTVNQHKKPLIM